MRKYYAFGNSVKLITHPINFIKSWFLPIKRHYSIFTWYFQQNLLIDKNHLLSTLVHATFRYYKTIKCRQCQAKTLRSDVLLDRGFTNEMKSLPIDCSFCQWNGILNNYQEHLYQSHSNLKCDYCGKQFNSVNEFNEHKVFEYQQLIVGCRLKDFGCNERIIRAKIQDHYLTEQHQHAVLKVVRQMLSKLNNRGADIDLPRTTTAEAYNPATTQVE
ncbi:unnamed protein product [Rotaria sp. Silwood1]|nr:unnamed protein product [Rotaria sp. Silwood1]